MRKTFPAWLLAAAVTRAYIGDRLAVLRTVFVAVVPSVTSAGRQAADVLVDGTPLAWLLPATFGTATYELSTSAP